jgi:hypothetical protein
MFRKLSLKRMHELPGLRRWFVLEGFSVALALWHWVYTGELRWALVLVTAGFILLPVYLPTSVSYWLRLLLSTGPAATVAVVDWLMTKEVPTALFLVAIGPLAAFRPVSKVGYTVLAAATILILIMEYLFVR